MAQGVPRSGQGPPGCHRGARTVFLGCLRRSARHPISALSPLGSERAKYCKNHRNCGILRPKTETYGTFVPQNQYIPVFRSFRHHAVGAYHSLLIRPRVPFGEKKGICSAGRGADGAVPLQNGAARRSAPRGLRAGRWGDFGQQSAWPTPRPHKDDIVLIRRSGANARNIAKIIGTTAF